MCYNWIDGINGEEEMSTYEGIARAYDNETPEDYELPEPLEYDEPIDWGDDDER